MVFAHKKVYAAGAAVDPRAEKSKRSAGARAAACWHTVFSDPLHCSRNSSSTGCRFTIRVRARLLTDTCREIMRSCRAGRAVRRVTSQTINPCVYAQSRDLVSSDDHF
jgi:hypothetical protein